MSGCKHLHERSERTALRWEYLWKFFLLQFSPFYATWIDGIFATEILLIKCKFAHLNCNIYNYLHTLQL